MAISKGLFIFFAFMGAVAALAYYVSQQPGGYMDTRGGSKCSWRTEGEPTTERALIARCSCPNGAEYECKYQGRPDEGCPKFWKNLTGYFLEIVDKVSREQHGCDSEFFKISMCLPKEFKVMRIGGATPKNC